MGKKSVAGGKSSNERAWRRLVNHSRRDPLFVGWALGEYGTAHGLTDEQVLEWLECRPGSLSAECRTLRTALFPATSARSRSLSAATETGLFSCFVKSEHWALSVRAMRGLPTVVC